MTLISELEFRPEMSPIWRRRTRRFLIVAAVLLVLPAAGALYQTISVRRESSRFPPPGRLVDVGARRLHLICIGRGQPAVIFESSGLGSALSAEAARVEIGRHTEVCSYDRMGMGWSDPGPATISIGMLATDLERLLNRAGVRPPYILVPASIGGLTSEMFARRYPDRVAGLVFVDAAWSGVLEWFAPRLTSTITIDACLAQHAARLGALRLIDPLGLRTQQSAPLTIALLYRAEPMATLCGLVRGMRASVAEFRAAPRLARDVPLAVLTAETTEGLLPPGVLPPGFGSDADALIRERRALHQELSRQSSRGTWRVVPGSDHLIGNSQPHAVASAVVEMVTHVRHLNEIGLRGLD